MHFGYLNDSVPPVGPEFSDLNLESGASVGR